MPNPAFNREGFFCELENRQSDRIIFPGPRIAKNFTYVGRPIKNIQHIPMRFIPPEIFEEKSRNSILTELDSHDSEKLLRLYYGSFSIPNLITQSEIDVPTDIFRPADANVINALVNFLEENLQRLERDDSVPANLYDALFLTYDDAQLQIHARLNSSGVLQVAAKSIAPILAAFFIAAADIAPAGELTTALKSHQISVLNSSCPSDTESPRLIQERLFGIIDMLGEDRLSDVCERVRELKQRTGASVDSTVKQDSAAK